MAVKPSRSGTTTSQGTSGGISSEALRKRHENAKKRWGSAGKNYLIDEVTMWTPKDGANAIRIVSPLEAKDWEYYGMDVHLHRNVGPEQNVVLCLNRMFGHKCPICELQTDELWKTDRDLAKTYYPEWRIIMWMVDTKEADPAKKDQLMIWSASNGTANDILGQSHKKEADVYVDVSDPDNGRVVYFDREGKGKLTKYKNVQISEIVSRVDQAILDQRLLMADLLLIPEYADVVALMKGEAVAAVDTAGETGGVAVDLDSMDKADLLSYIMDNELEIKPRRDWSDSDIRDAIKEHLGLGAGNTGGGTAAAAADTLQAPECFGKEYDRWEDCARCDWAKACAEPPLLAPERKPSRQASQPDKTVAQPAGDDLKKRMQDAISRRKNEVSGGRLKR